MPRCPRWRRDVIESWLAVARSSLSRDGDHHTYAPMCGAEVSGRARRPRRSGDVLDAMPDGAGALPQDASRQARDAPASDAGPPRGGSFDEVFGHGGKGTARSRSLFDRGLVEAGSVDMILTDPPYVRRLLPEWPAIAELAAVALRPAARSWRCPDSPGYLKSWERLTCPRCGTAGVVR